MSTRPPIVIGYRCYVIAVSDGGHSVLTRLAQFTIRRRRLILVLAVVGFAVAGALGGGVAKHLSSGGFDDPSSESSQAKNVLEDHFKTGSPNLVLLVKADSGTVDATTLARAGQQLTTRLAAEPGVTDVASY